MGAEWALETKLSAALAVDGSRVSHPLTARLYTSYTVHTVLHKEVCRPK